MLVFYGGEAEKKELAIPRVIPVLYNGDERRDGPNFNAQNVFGGNKSWKI